MEHGRSKRVGVVIGGSGLIGGTIVYFFKKYCNSNIQLLAPNSKKMSLRNPDDIKQYIEYYRPDFIINSAIAAIDSDPKMAYEVNYLGSINLAKAAIALKIPYIYISSAAVLENGLGVKEDQVLPLVAEMSHYAKSKLMCERSLANLSENEGLDYTAVRLAIVYGKHDHKIQGFHRLLFSIADQSMPWLFTRKDVCHSYTNAKKIGPFIDHILNHRDEFRGEVFNFVDSSQVSLPQLILTIKSFLELQKPRNFYMPLDVAQFGAGFLAKLVKMMARIGIEARMPAELMFLENFYESQVLSTDKLKQSSFRDPFPQETIFGNLPDLIEYYLTRWEQLNLISGFNKEFFDPAHQVDDFLIAPESLLHKHHTGAVNPFCDFSQIDKDQ